MQSTGMFPAPAPHIGLRHIPLRPARLLAPLHGSDWNSQPLGTFTLRLSTALSPFPSLSMTTTVAGLLLLAGLSPAGMAANQSSLGRLFRSYTNSQCRP